MEIFARNDAHDAVARGLRLGRDNGEPFTDERIHQRRFADIGIADDIYKT